jgi:hypothetical protein
LKLDSPKGVMLSIRDRRLTFLALSGLPRF